MCPLTERHMTSITIILVVLNMNDLIAPNSVENLLGDCRLARTSPARNADEDRLHGCNYTTILKIKHHEIQL